MWVVGVVLGIELEWERGRVWGWKGLWSQGGLLGVPKGFDLWEGVDFG